MWKLLSLFALVVAIEGYENSSDHLDYELLATGSVVYAVDKRLEKLKKEVEKAPKFSLKDAYSRVAKRVEDLEKHCEEGKFQCGGTLYQCVHPLKVCDGVHDCLNGHDEDSDVCFKDFLTPGTEFNYRLSLNSCLTWRDRHLHVRVKELTRSKFFSGTAEVTLDFGLGEDGICKGEYNYAKRELVVFPSERKLWPYKLVCDFSGEEKIRAECKVETLSSGLVCGYVFLSQKD